MVATVLVIAETHVSTVERLGVVRESTPVHLISAVEPGPTDAAAATLRSDTRESTPFTTIGVALDREPTGPVRVRWRTAGTWSQWNELDVEADAGPDRNSPEHRPGVVTEPVWVDRADAYQIEVPSGSVTDGAADALLVKPNGTTVTTEVSTAAGASLNAPPIATRSAWGARSAKGSATIDNQLKLAVVHHSATPNGYTADQVPSILRSIQAFHIDGRGWDDIAYNFIVDRFGRMWEGRGSADQLVRGAHAAGFNTSTVGVMVLGDYGSLAPTDAQLDSVGELISWKFANYGIDPATSVAYTSGGSTSIPEGRVVTLPRVVGHRDIGSTSCPGNEIYRVLWAIRSRVDAKMPAKLSPSGDVRLKSGPGSIAVEGWAADLSTPTAPIDVHVYLDGGGTNLGPASLARPDVAAANHSLGADHGFSRVFTGVAPGTHTACVYAINVGQGANVLLGCPTVEVGTGDPLGAVDAAVGITDGRIRLGGFAVDPDTADPIAVHVYVDGRGFNLGAAADPSPASAADYSLYGPNHGFTATLGGFAPGDHRVCVFGINTGPGENRALECRTVTVPGGNPFGSIDAVRGLPDGGLYVAGWVLDPDTDASAAAHVYVDGGGINLGAAAAYRPDVGQAYGPRGFGPLHGFTARLSGYSAGSHRVCIYGINVGVGANVLLGCRTVEVPGGSPFGSLDAVSSPSPGTVSVGGWAIDPDTSAPIAVHVYFDGQGFNLEGAAAPRGDVGSAFADYGPNHGFNAIVTGVLPGVRRACLYGINVGAGANSLIGCRDVTVG